MLKFASQSDSNVSQSYIVCIYKCKTTLAFFFIFRGGEGGLNASADVSTENIIFLDGSPNYFKLRILLLSHQ